MSIEARFTLQRDAFALEVDLHLPSRGVTAILGKSGSGKTSLLRAIAGLDRARDGFLKVDGRIWQDGTLFLPVHRRPLGYVFQEASLFAHLSVRRNLGYGYSRVPSAARKVRFEQAVELLGIGPLLDRYTDGLSGGERQRVAMARALLTSPELLLMDEPLAALDQESKNAILPYLEQLHRELDIPVLYVSHSADEVARLADHLVLIESGKVQAAGPVNEILTRVDLPLAHAQDAESILEARIAGHDDEYALSYLDFPGGRFTVARTAFPVGSRVRLRILARDVSLTLERQSGTSILNIISARVVSLYGESPSQYTVTLDAGGQKLLARITRKSADLLQLQPGKPVYAQVKSVALLS